MFVVYVMVGCLFDGLLMDRCNRLFCELCESGLIELGSFGLVIIVVLQLIESELVIMKSCVGVFMGMELDEFFWVYDIEILFIVGVIILGVVLMMVCQVFDLDYQLVVFRDGCVDGDVELYDYFMVRVIFDYVMIIEIDEVVKILCMQSVLVIQK